MGVVGGLGEDQRGKTGLETAIVLVAFVLVATVFAFAILSSGLVAAEKSKETALGSLGQASGTLMVRGEVVGISNSSLTALDNVKFTLGAASQSHEAVEVSAAATVISYLDEKQALNISPSDWTATWLIGSGPMLDPREQVEIVVNLTGLFPLLGPGKGFTILVKPNKGAVVRIKKATPVELAKVVQLTSRSGLAPTPTPMPGTPTPAPTPTTVSFGAVADSYTKSDAGKVNDNFGSETQIKVKSHGNNWRSLVRFDVSSIPGGSTMTSATLILCATKVPGATRTYEVHRATASWSESVITWNNQPSVAGVSNTAATPASPACMTWTVTSDVQAWVDGTANNGWRVNDSVESSATKYETKFRSREDAVVPTERPKLEVKYK